MDDNIALVFCSSFLLLDCFLLASVVFPHKSHDDLLPFRSMILFFAGRWFSESFHWKKNLFPWCSGRRRRKWALGRITQEERRVNSQEQHKKSPTSSSDPPRMPLREESPLSFVRPESGWAVVGSFSRHFFSSSSLTPVNRSRLCLFRMGEEEEEETVNTLAYDAFLPTYLTAFRCCQEKGTMPTLLFLFHFPPFSFHPSLGGIQGTNRCRDRARVAGFFLSLFSRSLLLFPIRSSPRPYTQ